MVRGILLLHCARLLVGLSAAFAALPPGRAEGAPRIELVEFRVEPAKLELGESFVIHARAKATGVALGSFLLISLLLGFRFYYRFRKHRKQAAEKMLDILNINAGNAWKETLEEIVNSLNRLRTDIHNRIDLFSDL